MPTDPPGWVAPMLPTLVRDLPTGGDWTFERKHDGFRCIAVRRGDEVALWSRSGKPLENNHVVAALRLQSSATSFVLDGELAWGQFGDEADHGYHAFDVLESNGVDHRPLPLADRLAHLSDLLDPLGALHVVEGFADGSDLFAEAAESGWEGVVAKDLSSSYTSGRSRNWRKLKCVQTRPFVIGGYTEPSGSRSGLGAIMVGYFDDTGFRYAGKVGTGFTHELLMALRKGLDAIEVADSPFVDTVREKGAHWVEPGVVAAVEFLEWSNDNKLRHPSFKGLLADVEVTTVVR